MELCSIKTRVFALDLKFKNSFLLLKLIFFWWFDEAKLSLLINLKI